MTKKAPPLHITSIVLFPFGMVLCGLAPTWNSCHCRWDTWAPWNTCNEECNGFSVRERKVWQLTIPECHGFTKCATTDMGFEKKVCNQLCYNGGTVRNNACDCPTGFYGRCCKNKVTCGKPPAIENGRVIGSTYTFGNNINYMCNKDYNLVNGSPRRICSIHATWSGKQPRCAYFNSCKSNPCLHGSTCVNIPDDYNCLCTSGWSGNNCEKDIQPPLALNCSSDKTINVNALTENVTWENPDFFDPHGKAIKVSSNFPTNRWLFSWGDYVVQYSAIKPSNALSAECVFDLHVRPHQCKDLVPPRNGSVVCNDWKTDFGKLCIYLCHEKFTVPKVNQPNMWFVCGATGEWLPATLPNCTVPMKDARMMSGYPKVSTFKDCAADKAIMQDLYIQKLKNSPYKTFCDSYPEGCSKYNVTVQC